MIWLDPYIDPRVQQAVVAGLFLALGWVVNGWATRRREDRARADRVRDVQRALFAEIGNNVANLGSESQLRTETGGLIERMEEDPDFTPFIPRERGDMVFHAALEDLSVLPRVTIDPVVAYYAQISAIAALAEDMREADFRALGPTRRRAIYRDYVEMKVQALRYGQLATHLITVFAREGKEAAEIEAVRLRSGVPVPRVSSPAADPSGR
ncbi:hypothetical protein BCF33_0171 [Hasllibacter halocynthiae]|uniref:Uncharacterized protein n=1 Tax=Hasllibacter halocynthiae TaxID=595589 RepID=A0A2T0X6L7_9RHOB|nr:hypothetical protein [Hasllibacter halocynthiae]PRY94579.1 hypothetical protein BCF33_0171 [Hasllibacter halocynthiae]